VQAGFTVNLGAQNTAPCNGTYWVTVNLSGTVIDQPNMVPGQGISYSESVSGSLNEAKPLNVNAHLPIHNRNSNDQDSITIPDFCDTCHTCTDPTTCFLSFNNGNRYVASHDLNPWTGTHSKPGATVNVSICFPRKGRYRFNSFWVKCILQPGGSGSASATNIKLKVNGTTVATFADMNTFGTQQYFPEFDILTPGTYAMVFEGDLDSDGDTRAQLFLEPTNVYCQFVSFIIN
jgi:hypothetical protein